jgi:Rha family phage regulatory protein
MRESRALTRNTFDMNRDGFALLTMGFTGKRATEFKLAYTEAVNRMEEELRRKRTALSDFSYPVATTPA